ncbi:MAG: CYTH domain-containing protein [Calditrichae bacterium]|nr:CYTH domain-containing protein [Calditrichia bacterium]
MGREIERKFLVKDDGWRKGAVGKLYCQGYISRDEQRAVRVRIVEDQGFLTIKGRHNDLTRLEFEYEIPLTDARELLDTLCQPPLIEKTRYRVNYAGNIWEIDVFSGDNAGLIVAEIELSREDQPFELPSWAGREVTGDPRYLNTNLSKHPYLQWSKGKG